MSGHLPKCNLVKHERTDQGNTQNYRESWECASGCQHGNVTEVAETPVQRVERIFSVDSAIETGGLTNKRVIDYQGPKWIRNSYAIAHMVDPVHENLRSMWGQFEGMTAVIASTGPSLDRNIEELKRCDREKFRLFATTSALNPLVANGIIPDFAAINDNAANIAAIHFDDLTEYLTDVPLILSTCSAYRTVRNWPGPKLYYNDFGDGVEFPLFETGGILTTQYPEFWNVPVAGCTTNLATRVAAPLMGFSRVIHIGMDLGFDPVLESGHCTKYDRDESGEWVARPPVKGFYQAKAQWLMHACPNGCEHCVVDWAPGEPVENEKWVKCDNCKTELRHIPTSSEYLFYYRNILHIAGQREVGVAHPITGEMKQYPVEVLNGTGGGIGLSLKQCRVDEVLA